MAHWHEEIFARLGLWNEAHGLQVRICDEDFPRAPDIVARRRRIDFVFIGRHGPCECRSEEHTSEPQSLMRISYAVFCLQTKTANHNYYDILPHHSTTHHITLYH